VKAIVARKSVHPTFEDALKNQRVLDATSESARTRNWVNL
jgi:predicted dehydrogenase